MGKRPTKPKRRRQKTIVLGVRTTVDVRDQVQVAADAENRSMSTWIENLILAALRRTE